MKYKRLYLILTICLLSSIAFAQTGSLEGKVTDSAGSPVEGAAVLIDNTKFITTTDSKGNYKVDKIPAGEYTVNVAVVGYNSLEQKAEIKENQTTDLDFHLLQKINQLNKVDVIRPIISSQGMGHMPEQYDGVIYSGMKTEILVLDSVDANKAQNNPRETLGRLPGSNYSETEGGGFPSNGIAFRGLIPTQSVEIQTRQNGYNLSGDVYGYPESYYLPPLIAVSRIEVIRGESSLQFGPQFGGVINYQIKDGPLDKPWEFSTEETGGSYGFASSVIAGGGTYKDFSYYSFIQYKSTEGWRPNSDVSQVTGFAKVEYHPSDRFKIGLEYTLLRNKIHMPGGLTDAEFDENPDQSFRARNWLTSPWNLLALTSEYKISDNSTLTLKSVLNMSQRNLVWKNEDGGPQVLDTITPSLAYVPREVEHEGFTSLTNELRSLTNYHIGKVNATLAVGLRYFDGSMARQEGGPGSTGIDFDMNLYGGNYANSLNFTTQNIAPFIENTFHFGRLSVTPGFRYEYIRSTVNGYITDPDSGNIVTTSLVKTWYIPLAGMALQFRTSDFTNIYGNIAQSYEPTTYENLTPIGNTSIIDPNMKDVSGFNSDLGWRGKLGKFINFDVDGFYIAFNEEIGIESLHKPNDTTTYTYRTNVGDAVHKGIETYVELHLFRLFSDNPKAGDLSFFNSYAYDVSKYVTGPFIGNFEEMAPQHIERLGLNYTYKHFSTTFVYSYSSVSWADANNTVYNADNSTVGIIPAYYVVDWSSTIHLKNYQIKFGVSNLLGAKYFNLRTDEYPGPGIIPAPGRNFYAGISASF